MRAPSAHHSRRFRPVHGALLALLILVTLVHLFVIVRQPEPELWGDEAQYQTFAYLDATARDTSLLPGHLRFDHRPELQSRVYAVLYRLGWRDARSIAGFQLFLFLAVVTLVFMQAKALGLGDVGAFASAALLALFPWFGFHVHSLWPEMLHAFLFGGALLFLLAYLRSFRLGWLLPSALFLGYALFAKGLLVPFLPLIVLFVAWAGFRAFPEAPTWIRLSRAGGAAGVYVLVVALVVGPQLVHNARAGHGWRLAANRWWNLELGLTLPVEAGLPSGNLDPWRYHVETSFQYGMAAPTISEREELAKERTLAFVRDTGVWTVVGRQLQKLWGLLVRGESSFDQSLTYRRRWGAEPPVWLAMWRTPARWMWYAILLLGLIGLALVVVDLAGREPDSRGWLFLCLFLGLFVLALLAVPIKVRMLMPLVPVLCLFAGVVVERLADRYLASRLT